MILNILKPQDYRDMPWKNGGGSTCELFRLPHPRREGEFALRLSIAQVAQGGPFSHFPGVDRQLMLLAGAGMRLRFGDGRQEVLDQVLQPIQFAGEQDVDCELLAGPLQDFNLMVARDWGSASLREVHCPAGGTLALNPAPLQYCHVLAGELACEGQRLTRGETLCLSAYGPILQVSQDATVVVIEAQAGSAI